MKAIAMKSPEGGREQPIIYIRTDERSDEVDVTPHAALMPCLPPFFPPSLLPSFPPSSPRSANASIDLSFYRIYRIEGGREGGRREGAGGKMCAGRPRSCSQAVPMR